MIEIEEINAATNDVKPLFSELQNLYDCLPETRCCCDQPGICCAFLPQMTWVEALQWVGFIKDLPAPARPEILRKFVEFYLTTPLHHTGCPFLMDGNCGIYEYRVFACRAYGLWSQQNGDRHTRESRHARQALLQLWEQFGVEIPAETEDPEIDYCAKVRSAAEISISDIQLMDVLQQIYRLDQVFPDQQTKFETEYHSDFSFLIASLVLGYRKAILGKFAVIKEISRQGPHERLEQMLDRATAEKGF